MKLVRIALLLAGAAAASVALIACGDNDGGTPAGGNPPTATRPAARATVPPAGAITVTARDFSFTPSTITATANNATTFVLENSGSAQHTLTLYEDEDFTNPVSGADTERVSPGSSGRFTTTFSRTGDFYFRCEVHPTQMQGEIEVS